MEENGFAGRITPSVGERHFTLERLFDAPRELVFDAFTRPEHVARWWAPNGYTIPVCKIDLRPGGIWHYCMRSPEGEEHWVKSVYREVIRPERLVYTSVFADENANPLDVIPEQLGTMTFIECDGGTKLVVYYQFASADDLRTTLDMGMIEGMSETFANLAGLLRELRKQDV